MRRDLNPDLEEQVLEYLRSRSRVQPPIDLVGSIAEAVEAATQQRRSWFAPFIPAVAVGGAAAVVLAVAVLIGEGPEIGPPPGGSPSTGETAPTPTVEPSPSEPPDPQLLEPGDVVTLDATDARGRWGTVTLTRGDDVGGYDDGSVPPESFVVGVHVEYVADRSPDPLEFGQPDWTLVAAEDLREVGTPLPPGGRREGTRPSLATYPGAIDIFTNPLEGWLLFEVSREHAERDLTLVYQPVGLGEPVATFAVREPNEAPEPVAAATPAPTPQPVTYVEKPGYPFTVIDSAEADELFATPDTCTNPDAGYTVTYPDAWFTNTDIGDWAPCTWFSPVFYSVGDDPNEVPPQIEIVLVLEETTGDSPTGADSPCDALMNPFMAMFERPHVAGLDAVRSEMTGCSDPDGATRPVPAIYEYRVEFGELRDSPDLLAHVEFEGSAHYELSKAVLDRIMALIEFDTD